MPCTPPCPNSLKAPFPFWEFSILCCPSTPAPHPKPLLFNRLQFFLDTHLPTVVTSHLIVSHHLRRFTSSPRNLCVLRVSALDSSFPFVFFNVQRSNLQTLKRVHPNSFPLTFLADPHPLTLVESYCSKTEEGWGPVLIVIPSKARDLLFPSLPRCFVTSLLPSSERLIHVPKTTYRSPVPTPERPRPSLPHAD